MKHIYETEDGKQFINEAEADAHEDWLKELENARTWATDYCAKNGLTGKILERLAHAAACYKLGHIPEE